MNELQIYCDMDCVITDFYQMFNKYSSGYVESYAQTGGSDKFWNLVGSGGIDFWCNMEWMSDGKELWNYLKSLNYKLEIITAPSPESYGIIHKYSVVGKRLWVKKNLGDIKIHFIQGKDKCVLATPTSILIDDTKLNIDNWTNKGGIGILHKNTKDTIKQLENILPI